MNDEPQLLTHLADIAPKYDALICYIWGVLHNGATAFSAACSALKHFRERHGRVVLLTNAPRPTKDLEDQFRRFGVPLDRVKAIEWPGQARATRLRSAPPAA